MDNREEMILFAVYCIGFITIGIMLFIATSILDQLTRERVQLQHRDEARIEMRSVSHFEYLYMNLPTNMESFFVIQILLAIAVLSSFCSIMLFLMIVLPYYTTNKAWQKFEGQNNVIGCDLDNSGTLTEDGWINV